eukprot:TRINITY_DN5516_c0_g1_i1.p1 TRINITY_DN5516_c0_g1~~TRINITY_DN5516_c0_g1_i1.p1  ORF type:complete len:311 (+),score=51.97 TRINITY_DN5516_c0_g1_i1:36-935(+)
MPGDMSRSWQRFVAGGLSEMFAVSFTHPADVLKVRLQLTGEGCIGSNRLSARDFVAVGRRLVLQEGIQHGLYSGISASWLRQSIFGTLRHGLYGVFEQRLQDTSGNISLMSRLQCATVSGALAAVVANPVDVVLIRMQSDGGWPQEQRRNYRHAVDGLQKILRFEGVRVLYRGCGPTTARAVLVTTSQVCTYEEAKARARKAGCSEGLGLHLGCAMLSATVACVVTHPVDVVKTRIMNMQRSLGASYAGPVDVIRKTLAIEGPLAFYKGLSATCLRLWPHTVLLWLAQERIGGFLRSIS